MSKIFSHARYAIEEIQPVAQGWSTASTLQAHTSGGYGGAPVSVHITGTPGAAGVNCSFRLHLREVDTGMLTHTDVDNDFPCRVGDTVDLAWQQGGGRVLAYNRTRNWAEFYRFDSENFGFLDSEDQFPWVVGLGAAAGLAYITPNLFLPLLPPVPRSRGYRKADFW